MDIRRSMRDHDIQIINWCHEANVNLHILLTKADKIKKGPAMAQLHQVQIQLKKKGVSASLQLFSALKKKWD